MNIVQEAQRTLMRTDGRTIGQDRSAVQPPQPDRDRSTRKRIEARFADVESRLGVKLNPPPDPKTGRKMKHKALMTWRKGAQARTISAAGRELVEELIDTAGKLDHRYADGRMVAVLYVGQRTLAERMGLSVRGVQARMRALVDAGIIARQRRTQGRNSITVVELMTTLEPLKSQDLPRRTYPCATDAHTHVPQTHTPVCESSSSESSPSERNPLSHDYDARVLSAACDADAGETATAPPPSPAGIVAVRRAMMVLGVNQQRFPTIEARHKPETIAGVVNAVQIAQKARPTSKSLRDPEYTGELIGGILQKGNQFPAWMREVIENANVKAETIERTLSRLEAAELIADR